MSPEATVVRGYIDWLTALPWRTTTTDDLDIGNVQKVLDEDHFGLEKVKDRITEYLSVLKLTAQQGADPRLRRPPALQDVARQSPSRARSGGASCASRSAACGTKPRSEAIAARTSARCRAASSGTCARAAALSPFLLDKSFGKLRAAIFESALLEGARSRTEPHVRRSLPRGGLRSLGDVLFICTANSLYSIPPALVDRMEVIRLPATSRPSCRSRAASCCRSRSRPRASSRATSTCRTRRCATSCAATRAKTGVRSLERGSPGCAARSRREAGGTLESA